MAYDAGEAFIRFTPNFSGMVEAVSAQARRDGDAYARIFEEQLRRHQPTIRPDVDGARASAELAALRRQVDELRRRVDIRVNTNASSASRDAFALRSVLITLAPAVIPLAGAAAAGGGALAAMGVAGVLALKGIKTEMKAGTELGKQYTATINTGKSALATLEQTAARNLLGGFQSSVSKLNSDLPAFNVTVGESARHLGDIGAHVAGGLVSGFTTFAPLISKVETEVDHLAGRFETWASGPGGAHFAQALSDDFDMVVPTIEHVAETVGKAVAAFAPAGGVIVHTVDSISMAINHIPVGVLTALATGFVAVRTATLVSGGLEAVAGTVTRLGRSTADVRGLGSGLGLLGTTLSRIAPYAAVAVGLHFALDAAAKSTDSWATSTSSLEFGLHRASVSLSDLFSGHPLDALSDAFGKGSDKAVAYRNHVLALNAAVDQLASNERTGAGSGQTLTLTGPRDNGSFTNQRAVAAAQQADTYYAAMTRILTVSRAFDAQLTHSPISQQSALFTNQASAIESANQKLTKFLTSGDKTKFTYEGVTVSVAAYDDALARSNGDVAKAEGFLRGQIDALRVSGDMSDDYARKSAGIAKEIGNVAAKFKLTGAQVDLYSSILDVNGSRLGGNTAYQKMFEQAIGGISRAVKNASGSFATLLDAEATFNGSTKTAADKAALLGAALTANMGDALANANLNLTAASAAEGVASAVDKYSDSISRNGNILGQLTKTAHGYVILQPQLTEGGQAIANALTQQANSAIDFSKSLYQTEVHTKGQKVATQDAIGVYMGYRDQLKSTLTQQLGNADAAQHLTDKYLGVPKNIKSFVKLFGKNDIDSAITSLTTTLGHFSKIIATAVAKLNHDDVTTGYDDVVSKINGLNGRSVTIPVAYRPVQAAGPNAPLGGIITGGGKKPGSANGSASWTSDGKLPPGYSTAGERGWELLYTDQRGRTAVVEHSASMAITGLPDRLPGYASGSYTPPSLLVPPSSTTQSSASKAEAKAAADAKQALQAASEALSAFKQSVGLVADSVRSAEHDLLKAAKAAGASSRELAGLRRVSDKLVSTYHDLNDVQARLGTAPTKPTAYDNLAAAKGEYTDLRNSIVSAITGSFALAAAGVRDTSYSDSVKQGVLGSFSLPGVAATPVTTSRTVLPGVSAVMSSTASTVAGSDILSQLRKSEHDAHAFVNTLKRLRSEGLPQGLLDQLAQAGPSALPQAQALLAMTPKALASVGSTYRNLAKDSNALSSKPVTFGSIYGEAKQAAADAKSFAYDLRKLASEGLSPALVAQLAAAGPSALPQVRALLQATPKQLKSLNYQVDVLKQSGGSLGTSVATDLYGAGVQAAQGIVDGLKSQERDLEKQMKHLADTMVNRFKKDLDIHSPSRVFHKMGTFTGQGLVGGIRQQIPIVSAAVGDLVNAQMATTTIAGRATVPAGGAAGASFSMPITQMPNEDGAALAARVAGRVDFALSSR